MLRNADYIWDNILIEDGTNTTLKYCKKAQEGVDLSVKNIYKIKGAGYVSKTKSYIPDYELLNLNKGIPLLGKENLNEEFWFLEKATYIAELDCGVNFGPNDTGMIILRSSLNRSGVSVIAALWDSGFTTRDKDDPNKVNTITVRLNVDNEYGFYLEKHARICQLIIFENEDTTLYDGQYQNGSFKSNLVDEKIV